MTQFGMVNNAEVVYDMTGGQCTGYGYVDFAVKRDAQIAVHANDGSSFKIWDVESVDFASKVHG